MNGGVRKRGSKWYYYFEGEKVGGKRQKVERVGGKTKKEAEAALAAAINEYNQAGMVFEPTKISVADYLDQWYELYCKMNLKYNTQVGYLQIIEKHLNPRFGKYALKSLNPAIIQEYVNDLKLHGYAKNSITGIMSTFSAALDYAVEPLHYIPQNPIKMVRMPKIERKPRERIILTMDEWNQIIERFRKTRYYIPLMIGFYTGLRISEVFGLTWDDVDLEKRTITVNKQVLKRNFGVDVKRAARVKGKKEMRSSWYFNTPKTESSNRVVPFGQTLYEALKEEKMNQVRNELKYGEFYTTHFLKTEKDEKGNDMFRIIPAQKCIDSQLPRVWLICIAENGQYTSTDSFKYAARIIHNELQLGFDFHSLRHTHATMLIEAGANVKNVQARLGHTRIETTLQTYVHDTEKMGEESVELFEQLTSRKSG